MFGLRTVWDHALDKPIDMGCAVVANVLRTKNGAAQLVLGTLEGELQIYKFSGSFQHQDLVASVVTGQAILGVFVGSFSSPYIVQPNEPLEKLEIAVVHPFAVSIYTPRRGGSGEVTLGMVGSVELSQHACSFCVAHRRTVVQDEKKNRRLSVQSYVVVKSMQGQLVIVQGRQIVGKITLSERYSLPSPLCFNALADQLVVSTFEYEVIGLDFGSLLSQTLKEVVPRWTFCLNDRVQQLEPGRFFASDSSPQGEVCVALSRQLLWFNYEGKLLRELELEHPVLSMASVQPCAFNAHGKHPVVVSQLVLLRGGQLILAHNGNVVWVGAYGDAAVQPLQQIAGQQDGRLAGEDAAEAQGSTAGTPYDEQQPKEPQQQLKQLVPLPAKRKKLNYPALVLSPQALTPVFSGNAAAPQIFPQQPGLFLILDTEAKTSVCLFGIKTDRKALLPQPLPQSSASKELREQLLAQLKTLREQNVNREVDCIKLEAKLVGVKPSESRLVSTYQVVVTAEQTVENVVIGASMLCDLQIQFSGPGSQGKSSQIEKLMALQPVTLTVDLIVRKGQFVSPQQVWFSASGRTTDDHKQEVFARAETTEYIPLLSYNILDCAPASVCAQQRFKLSLDFKAPFNSLQSLLSKPGFSQKLLDKMGQMQGVLAFTQPNGMACFLQQTSQFQLCVCSNHYETMFAAVELLQQLDMDFHVKPDRKELSKYIGEFWRQKTILYQNQIEAEDYLARQLLAFQKFNTALGHEFFEQESPVLTLTIDNHFQNPAEETESWVLYLQALIGRVQAQKQEVDTYDQKLKGLLHLVSLCSSKPDIRDGLCYCDADVVPEALAAAAGSQGAVETLVEKLLE